MNDKTIEHVVSSINYIKAVLQNVQKEHENSLENLKKGTNNSDYIKKLENLIDDEKDAINNINVLLTMSNF